MIPEILYTTEHMTKAFWLSLFIRRSRKMSDLAYRTTLTLRCVRPSASLIATQALRVSGEVAHFHLLRHSGRGFFRPGGHAGALPAAAAGSPLLSPPPCTAGSCLRVRTPPLLAAAAACALCLHCSPQQLVQRSNRRWTSPVPARAAERVSAGRVRVPPAARDPAGTVQDVSERAVPRGTARPAALARPLTGPCPRQPARARGRVSGEVARGQLGVRARWGLVLRSGNRGRGCDVAGHRFAGP